MIVEQIGTWHWKSVSPISWTKFRISSLVSNSESSGNAFPYKSQVSPVMQSSFNKLTKSVAPYKLEGLNEGLGTALAACDFWLENLQQEMNKKCMIDRLGSCVFLLQLTVWLIFPSSSAKRISSLWVLEVNWEWGLHWKSLQWNFDWCYQVSRVGKLQQAINQRGHHLMQLWWLCCHLGAIFQLWVPQWHCS